MRFDWKKTIGPIEERHGHPSPWVIARRMGWAFGIFGMVRNRRRNRCWRFTPVFSRRRAYQSRPTRTICPGCLDEIEYVTATTNTKWARNARKTVIRAFKLNYVEIGNEDWLTNQKATMNVCAIYDAIKAKYPQLKTISTSRRPA